MPDKSLVPLESIEKSIHIIRGHNVMLDEDLARLYEVETRILVRNVKRHPERFPEDFMFQLTDGESEKMRSQIGISNKTRGGRRYNPYVFTEHGILMLSSVLNSDRAIKVNIEIMRAFVKMRRILSEHQELMMRIDILEERYDKQFTVVFDAIRQLMEPTQEAPKHIGFRL